VALRDAMNTVDELKKQIETSKESTEQQVRELIQEKAAVGQVLAASNEQSRALHHRLSVLSTQAAVALQEVQAQRSRADGLQVVLLPQQRPPRSCC
jgi:predicted  nucleic acid-binding Zn-ribbon protein